MRQFLLTVTTFLLILTLLAGCSKPQTEPTTEPTTEATTEATTEPAETPATEPAGGEAEEDVVYEGDASSYYIDMVYPEQIERYYTALSQQWDEKAYLEHGMSPLAARYYEGKPLDNMGFTFMDLDGDGIWELIIGAIQNAAQDPLIFEIWALKNDVPVLLAQSDFQNRYYLQYAQEDDLWSVAYEAENGAANHAVYYLHLVDGEFRVIQGIVFDAIASENDPWFMACDLDWDVSNDIPIDENTATAVITAGRKIYTAQNYIPYSQYK